LHSDGSLTARAVQPATVRAMLPSAARLPTLAATLIARADAALRNVDLRAAFAADIGAVTRLHVNSLDLSGAQGARLQLTGIDWTPADTQFDGTAVFGGGGLPAVVAAAAGRASSSAGRFTVAPWHAGGNAFGLTAGRFAITPAQVEAAAIVQLSTTVGGSRIEGLTLPLTARFDRLTGTLALGDGCLRAGLQRAAFGTAQLGATAVQLCPARPGPLATLRGGRLTAALAVGALALNGRARERSFRLTAAPFRLDLNGRLDAPVLAVPGIDLAGASGAWAAAAHLAVQARSTARGWAGAATVSGLRAGGPAVTASAGRARAKLANGIVSVDGGSIALADPGVIPAFNPLRLTDIAARLDGRSASGRGSVRLADGTTLATVRADYDLEQAKGHADITSELTFTPKLQPVDISGAVRGLVANVTGTATGAATLTIEGGRLGGSGSVRLAGVSLATAALGPVTGIDGTVAFDDIVALHTPPHQSLHVAALNPGIEIENIALLFQLRGRDTLAVERIAWPFTGGTMTVRPTVLRAGASRRTFTVDVDGLDAEQFLQRFEIKNLSATGRFDGTLPLAFEGASGRIVGGVLTARASGGVLQYVGEVGQASMGAAGRLAFDALRRLRYRTLRLSLDGDLDAEIVTGIDFTGTNEVPLTTGSRLPVRATGLPFKFGVTVRAPFRALLGTAASLGDARAVIRAAKAAP